MASTSIQYAKSALIAHLEDALGYKPATPKDFIAMRELIFRRTHITVSDTTLRRIWGYNREQLKTRESTYSILARAVGFKDWDDFQQKAHLSDEKDTVASATVLTRYIDVKTMLQPGDIVKLFWHPGRRCTVRYVGKTMFEIIEAENTRLQIGDTFTCHLIVAGQPLFLSQLIRGNSQPMAYICGKMHGGIQFEFSPE